MENIKKLILNTVASAVIEEKQKLTVTVASDKLHLLAKMLKENAALPFDMLIKLIGMDRGEELGVNYLLCSSTDLSK